MNLRITFALILLFLLPGALSAQSDWRSGYVVTLSGDTLHGMVRDRDTGPFGGLYNKVRLKKSERGKARFGPSKMLGYQWGDAKFIVLRTNTYPNVRASKKRIDPTGTPSVFRVVVEGPLSLYMDEFNDEDGSWINEVPYFKKVGDEQLVRATQGIFGLKKKLLSKYFADQPDLVQKIQAGAVKTPLEVVTEYGLSANPN